MYILFYTELPTGAFLYSILSIPTICMSRADQRNKATRNISQKLPELVEVLRQLANNYWVRPPPVYCVSRACPASPCLSCASCSWHPG